MLSLLGAKENLSSVVKFYSLEMLGLAIAKTEQQSIVVGALRCGKFGEVEHVVCAELG